MTLDPIWMMQLGALAVCAVLYAVVKLQERRWTRQGESLDRAKAEWDATHPAE